MAKKLQRQIETKLEKLSQLLDQITEAQAIDSNDPETWDSDALYDLVENLKETLTLLEDQKGKSLDQYGEPLIIEPGLCSLVDEWTETQEEEEDE